MSRNDLDVSTPPPLPEGFAASPILGKLIEDHKAAKRASNAASAELAAAKADIPNAKTADAYRIALARRARSKVPGYQLEAEAIARADRAERAVLEAEAEMKAINEEFRKVILDNAEELIAAATKERGISRANARKLFDQLQYELTREASTTASWSTSRPAEDAAGATRCAFAKSSREAAGPGSRTTADGTFRTRCPASARRSPHGR